MFPSQPITAGAEEEETHIVASCQQTRFNLVENDASIEVDIKTLNLAIVSGTASTTKKGKVKAIGQEKVFLSDAHLRLKSGVRYGLLGRNGSGKSTLLRALADRIIPGLAPGIRFALLQQTSAESSEFRLNHGPLRQEDEAIPRTSTVQTVLQHVTEQNAARGRIIRALETLKLESEDIDDPAVQIRHYRQLRYERSQSRLFVAQRNALHRSGTRGMHARKELLLLEQEVSEMRDLVDQDIRDVTAPEIQAELHEATATLADLQTQLDAISFTELETKAHSILRGLGFEEASLQKPFSTLSGGWRMRCQLAATLIEPAEVMILDEPTNFLDMQGKTIVLVSHDRDFVDSVCEEIIILEEQALKYFQGNLSTYELDFRTRVLYLTRMKDTQDQERSRVEKTIATAIKKGKQTGDDNKLKMAKSRQKKLENNTGMQVGLNGSRFKLNRDRPGRLETKLAAIEIPKDEQTVLLALPVAPELRFPGPLVSLEDVDVKYTSKGPLVLRSLNLSVFSGDRIGVVGFNGCGKSTLLKAITGTIASTKGTVIRHPRLRMGYYSQHAVEELQSRAQADPSATALSMLSADAGGEMTEQEMRGLLGSFGLPGRTASDVPVGKLSGGQLVRLALVLILWKHPNLLVLDEVTTHLDYRTVNAVAEALSDFNGAVILVTHDRFMIKRVIESERTASELDDEYENPETEEEQHRQRLVYMLDKGTLVRQEGGVRDFEKRAERLIAKLAR